MKALREFAAGQLYRLDDSRGPLVEVVRIDPVGGFIRVRHQRLQFEFDTTGLRLRPY